MIIFKLLPILIPEGTLAIQVKLNYSEEYSA